MINPQPSFTVTVDATNPGQFFACCGLLELAHRLWPGAEGRFDGNQFLLMTSAGATASVQTILQQIGSHVTADDSWPDKALRPVCLPAFSLRLDWWTDSRGQKTSLKLWAGQQTSYGIIKTLVAAAVELHLTAPQDFFNEPAPLTGRFGVDPRAAWNALDAGFSPNEQKMEVASYPAVELLAGVGLQRFRPVQNDNGGLGYATWSAALPVYAASVAATGLLPCCGAERYAFQVADRGSYKGLEFATPERRK